MIKKINKKKGILFWITGLSGSGKTSVSRKIYKKIKKKYGKTFYINGDDLRKIFELNGYSYQERAKIGSMYVKLFKKITDQNINVLFAGAVLIEKVRKWNRKNIDNYFEIFIKADIKKIIKKKIKKLYQKKNNVYGIEIKAEFPKKPNIILNNDFTKNVDKLANELIFKIEKKINK